MKYLLLLLIFLPLTLPAQFTPEHTCGTHATEIPRLLEAYGQKALANGDSVGTLLVRIYVLSDSWIRFSPNQEFRLRDALDQANVYFQGSGIQFALCEEPIYVDSISYNSNDYFEWMKANVDPRVVNIMSGSAPFVCGAAIIGGTGNYSNTIIVCNTGEVVAHEFGHLFGLGHTFQYEPGDTITAELVDGSNCDTTGDGVCDTHADPYPHGGDLDSCLYVGTVTDANGDLYDPPINNLMSYYNHAYFGCGPEQFSEGQFARMRGILNQELFYHLKQPTGMSFPKIEGAPTYVCLGDTSTFTLTGFPAGGTFSGDGISGGNTLFLGNLPAGDYDITYEVPPAQPVAPYEKIDVIQMAHGNGNEPDTSEWWQSFRAKETGSLQAIYLRGQAPVDEPFQWALYEGIGMQGSPFYQQMDTFPAGIPMQWHRFEMDSLLQQMGDSVYTLAFWVDSSSNLRIDKGTEFGSPLDMPGSISIPSSPFFSFKYHPCFATEILSTQAMCYQNIKRRVRVLTPREVEYALEDRYCITEGDVPLLDILPEEVSLSFVDFQFEINQMPDSMLRLENLGAGSHVVSVRHEDFLGCSYEREFPINVYDVPEVQLADTFCETDPPLALVDLWPASTYELGGVAIDTLNPDQLPAGNYTLDMYLPNVFDTLNFLDQELIWSDSGFTSSILRKDSLYWQSFRPDSNFYFEALGFRMGIFDTVLFASQLWKGKLNTGSLLLSDTLLVVPDDFERFPRVMKTDELSILMEKDTLYTLSMSPIDFTGFAGTLVAGQKDPYVRGQAGPVDTLFPEKDWLFQLYQQRERECGSLQTHHFEILALPESPIGFLSGSDTVEVGEIATYYIGSTWADSLEIEIVGGTCLNCPLMGDSLKVRWNVSGNQQLTIRAWNGCGEDNFVKNVQVITGGPTSITFAELDQIHVYPNPFEDYLVVQLEVSAKEKVNLDIYDMTGRWLKGIKHPIVTHQKQSFQISTKDLPSGMYLIKVGLGDQGPIFRKVMVKD